MIQTMASMIWVIGLIAWCIIRYPHMRRARKQKTVADKRSLQEQILLSLALVGLSLIPFIWVLSGFPTFANYEFSPVLGWIGGLVFVLSLVMFHLVHKQMGRNWSVTLEIREDHKLLKNGLYAYVRHPMYTSFFLWGLAQALLLPNFIAGLSGLAGVALLFFIRIGKEEEMLIEAFGDDYRQYMKETARIIPYIY